ncbi:MAG: hypothetical protein WBM41_02310, partial [Arenicellales bacterium]
MINTVAEKLIVLALILAASTHVSAQTNYAVVVGIDDYTAANLVPLGNAENDALRVATYFRS